MSNLLNLIKDITKPFNIDPYFTYAVGEVESNNTPFLANGSPIVRFEKHVFIRYLKKYNAPNTKLEKANNLKGSNFKTLEEAKAVDTYCAIMSTSYGMFQIMGFNHELANYRKVENFVEAMGESEEKQIRAFCQFIKNTSLRPVIDRLDFATFARRYNGPNYSKNNYDTKLKHIYRVFVEG